eukprot:gene15609-21092_t
MSEGSDLYISRFDNKDQPKEEPITKIVEAYGLRKCPKLVLQIAGPDLVVRQNALLVICDEFQNPYSVSGCADEGVIKVLADMVNDPDFITRVRATKALALAAIDAKGLQSIIADEVIPQILKGAGDPSELVRGNVYECLFALTKAPDGVVKCVECDVTNAFVSALSVEDDERKPIILRSIYNIVACEQGLLEAIRSNAVFSCINLVAKSAEHADNRRLGGELVATFYSDNELEILSEASKTLGFMCFDGRAKRAALDQGAIKQLINVLKFMKSATSDVKLSITISLMAITITDEGKIQIFDANGVEDIIALLYDDSKVVLLNALKIISNIAIYPPNREILCKDSTCVIKLRKLSKVDDKIVSRHSGIALNAVLWTP